MISDHLCVNGRLKNRAVIFQLPAKLRCVDQIAVVGQGQCSLDIIEYQRLCVFSGAGSRCGITDMSHADVSGAQPLQMLRRKDLIGKSHALVDQDFSLGSLCIADCNAAAFLSAVLQSQKAVINRRCNVVSVKIIDAEHTAFFMNTVEILKCLIRLLVHKVILSLGAVTDFLQISIFKKSPLTSKL